MSCPYKQYKANLEKTSNSSLESTHLRGTNMPYTTYNQAAPTSYQGNSRNILANEYALYGSAISQSNQSNQSYQPNQSNQSYQSYRPMRNDEAFCGNCLRTHSQENPENYEWLHELGHGKIISVFYEEPAMSGDWKPYDMETWKTHCRVVSHGRDLYEAHMKAFVNPQTRFARLRFNFEDGTSSEPNSRYYELERDYFAKENLCEK